MSAYKLDAEAFADLNDILQYAELRQGNDAADELETELLEAFQRLAAMPGLGHRRPDLTSKPQFFYFVDPYLIVTREAKNPCASSQSSTPNGTSAGS
jgi:plasmid stabilization system protein ParE